MNKSERNLEKVLGGKMPADETTAPLADVARRLEGLFDIEAPDSARERAMFAAAVGARQRATLWRYLAPAVAVASLLAAVFFAGRAAAPGDTLYPVRRVLQEVDLAPRLSDRVAHRLALAQAQLAEAEALVLERPRRAQVLSADVLKALGAIEELLQDLPNDEREVYELAAAELEDKARVTSITAASIIAGRQPGEPDDDRSGPGGGDDDRDPDGSGSDDDGSGSGSDDSGSGSDDSGSDDDGSGSGSGDSGSDDGSDSGSGSGDSGSGDGSGSGSGDSGSGDSGSEDGSDSNDSGSDELELDNDSGSGSDDRPDDSSGSGSGDSEADD